MQTCEFDLLVVIMEKQENPVTSAYFIITENFICIFFLSDPYYTCIAEKILKICLITKFR